MSSVNLCIFLGNLTRNPEIRYTPKGTAVTSFGIAVNEVWVNDQGEKQESVTFLDCDAWGRTAEIIEEYLTKGSPVHLQCHAKLDTWDDKKTGEKRSKVKFVVDKLTLLPAGKKKEEDEPPKRAQQPARKAAPPPRRPAPVDPDLDAPDDDDIPF